MKRISKAMLILFVVLLVFAGCQKKETAPKEVAGSFDADHNWQGDMVDIHIQGVEAGGGFNDQRETAVAQMLAKKTGVNIIWEQSTNEKWALQQASGDLPDVVRFGAADVKVSSTLINGGYLTPLDDYIEKWGPNLKANMGKQLAVSKAVHGGDHVYVIPTNTGPASMLYYPVLKWTWYRDAGYPEISDLDSFLRVLKAMVDKHPTTKEGKKTYGVSNFIDWGNTFPFFYPYLSALGYDHVSLTAAADYQTSDLVSQLGDDPKSVFWRVVEFMFKANQLGIFDPDTFTQTAEEHYNKQDDDQIAFRLGFWDRGTVQNDQQEVVDVFVPIPWKNGSVQGGAFNYLYEMGLAVTKNCKYPDAVVRLYDYTSSFDGIELLYNGIQGEDWNIVNGKPRPTDAILEARKTGVDLLRTRGINYGGNNFLITLSGITEDPRYDSYVNFTNIPEVAALANTPLDAEFAQHYGALSVDQVIIDRIEAGDMKDMSNYNALVPRMVPATPTDITRIQTNLQQLAATEWAPKCVFARNEAEFRSLKAQAIAAFREAGLTDLEKWNLDNWNEAKKKAEGFGL
jgi:multiple sugar transport system substrate-binding protein